MQVVHALLVASILIGLFSAAQSLQCYTCLSKACTASDLTANNLMNCTGENKYCQSSFTATANGVDIARGCVDKAAGEGACVDGLSVSLCTCNTDKCNKVDKTVKYPDVKYSTVSTTQSDGASFLRPNVIATFLFVMMSAVLGALA